LQVLRAVQTAGQSKVPFKIRARLIKRVQNRIGRLTHNATIAFTFTQAP